MQTITIKSYETKKSIVSPIIFLIIGLLLFIDPGKVTDFISYIFGGIFLALGIGKLVLDSRRNDRTTGDTFYSLIMVVLGLIFIFVPSTLDFILRLIIGIWIIINAINTIAIGANIMRTNKKSIVSLILGFILLAMGIYTVFVSNLVFSTLGLIIALYAVIEIVDYFYIASKNK